MDEDDPPRDEADPPPAVRDRFISRLAHELRSPLAIVLGYAELLNVRTDEETRREASQRIVAAAEQLALAVDDLLIVFAIDSDALTVSPSPTDAEAVVNDAVRLFEPRTDAHRFTTTSTGGACWVWADAEHLMRIVTNLLVSAVKRSPEGGDIEIQIRTEEDFAAVSVSDHGVGVAPERLAAAFERFPPIELVERGGVRSTGLELYKVRRLVELHGGTVSAESGRDAGLTITFRIPLAPRPEHE